MNGWLTLSAVLGLGCGEAAPPASPEAAELGYAIGFQVGGDFRQSGASIEAEAVAAGIRDALEQRDPALPKEEQETFLEAEKKRQTMKELDVLRNQAR